MTTFGIKHGAHFRPGAPPALHTAEYARDYAEVKALGDVDSALRPKDRADVARFYGGNPSVHVFAPMARQLSAAQGKTLSGNARIFALLHMAIADGLISSMEAKFHYNLWRPMAAIRAGESDGNWRTAADLDWLPLVATPPYPSYPGNYAGVDNAALQVLESVYGRQGNSITLTSANPAVDVTLQYADLRQVARDVHDARLYGGSHFRFDQEAGAWMGRLIGSYILRTHLRPVDAEDG